MRSKTLSVRINDSDYDFLRALAEEEKGDVSTKMRELYELGRVLFAIEKYKSSEASLGRAAQIAGVSVSKMLDLLREHNVDVNLDQEDYFQALKSLREVW